MSGRTVYELLRDLADLTRNRGTELPVVVQVRLDGVTSHHEIEFITAVRDPVTGGSRLALTLGREVP